MKAKDLAKILLEHPDFDVEVSISKEDGTDWGFTVLTWKITGLNDIGYSEKIISLNTEFDE